MKLTKFLSGLGAIDQTPVKRRCRVVPNFPFKQVFPAAVRNEVSGRKERLRNPPCIQEMSLMLACLKKSGYEQTRCSKEIEAFVTCDKNLQKEGKYIAGDGNRYPRDELDARLKLFSPKNTK